MGSCSTKAMVVLEGVPALPALEAVAGKSVLRAASPMGAALALTRQPAGLLVVHGGIGWHRLFVSSLSPEKRPPVLVYGGGERAVHAEWADEWLSGTPTPQELELRIRLARERARARRLNARRVFVDALTGLPNRRAAVRALVREAERARRADGALSLVLVDLDDFKAVNETEGHDAGDRLLRKVGAALSTATRGSELCARIGGDEFALVISGELGDAHRAAQRVKERLRAIGVSATTAAARLGRDERLQALYRRCDAQLRATKEQRRAARAPALPVHPPGVRELRDSGVIA